MTYSLDTQRQEKQLDSTTAPGSPVRVLYYVSYYQRMAGANRVLLELIKNLPETVTPLVVLAGEGRAAQAFRDAGIDVRVLSPGPSLNQFGKAMLRWSLAKRIWVTATELLPYTLRCVKLILSWQPDIVHIDTARGMLLIGAAALLLRCPIVGHMHGEPPFGGMVQTIFEKFSDRIITVCSSIQASLSPAARTKAVTVYNGIQEVTDLGQPIPWLEDLKVQGKLIVACFASVVPFKGHYHLLKAIAELNRRGWADLAVFICVGDMPQEFQDHADWLKQKQQELEIQNVIFTGWQSNPFPYYQLADIEVLPSVREELLDYGDRVIEVRGNEGFPTTHLEAMYFGLPVVGTAIAGVPEQIEQGVNGFVVPPSDPIALADALEKLLANPELRQQMGRAGRERVRQYFSTDTYVAGVMEVYRSLLSERTLMQKSVLSV